MIQRVRRSMTQKEQGFTLIELLVVIIIIGILAAIAIPVFLNQRQKGVDASLKSDLKNAATAAETIIADNPGSNGPAPRPFTDATVPADLAAAGFKLSPGNWISVRSVAAGYCLKVFNPGATSANAITKSWRYDSALGGFLGNTTNTPIASTGGACVGY